MLKGESQIMKRLLLALLLATAFALTYSGVWAQNANQPILAYRGGDIWKYDLATQTATQLTHWGYNGGPILSPDGGKIVYLSTASNFVAQYEAGTASQTGGSAPANIWLMDIATESFQLIADQSGASHAGILRSLPNWSPDSRQLAWLQLDPGLQSIDAAHLNLHDLASGLTSTLVNHVDLGFQGDDIRMPSLRWGEGGIARLHFDFRSDGANPFLQIQFIDPASGAMAAYDLGLNENRDNTVRDFIWVNHLGRSLMALQIKDYWDLIDPQAGTRSRLSDPPRLQNRGLYGGLQLIPLSVANDSGGWNIHWRATDGTTTYDTGYQSYRVNRNNRPGLSPDGTRVAWQDNELVSAWQIGMGNSRRTVAETSSRWAFPIPQPFGLVWTPTEWITTGALEGAQAAPALPPVAPSCPLAPLLVAGQQAILGPGISSRVRAAASLNADIAGIMDAGDVALIEAGPICADGYHWYFARNEEIAGWIAEGGAGDYWLLYNIDCANSPPIRLSATMSATVAGGRSLSVRNGKGNVDTAALALASPGDAFTITGRPECDLSGERWYPIQLGHILGWIAAGAGDEYYIERA